MSPNLLTPFVYNADTGAACEGRLVEGTLAFIPYSRIIEHLHAVGVVSEAERIADLEISDRGIRARVVRRSHRIPHIKLKRRPWPNF